MEASYTVVGIDVFIAESQDHLASKCKFELWNNRFSRKTFPRSSVSHKVLLQYNSLLGKMNCSGGQLVSETNQVTDWKQKRSSIYKHQKKEKQVAISLRSLLQCCHGDNTAGFSLTKMRQRKKKIHLERLDHLKYQTAILENNHSMNIIGHLNGHYTCYQHAENPYGNFNI